MYRQGTQRGRFLANIYENMLEYGPKASHAKLHTPRSELTER